MTAKKKVKPEAVGSMTLTVVQLYKAYNIDSDGRDLGAIGYFSTDVRARSACGDNAYSSVKLVDALQIARDDQSKEEYDYYLLDEVPPVKADHNFELFAKQLRDKAMAKLSETEKEVLGLGQKQ